MYDSAGADYFKESNLSSLHTSLPHPGRLSYGSLFQALRQSEANGKAGERGKPDGETSARPRLSESLEQAKVMGAVRDYCGNQGIQRGTRQASSTGTRGEGWVDKSFLQRNARKMATNTAKPGIKMQSPQSIMHAPWNESIVMYAVRISTESQSKLDIFHKNGQMATEFQLAYSLVISFFLFLHGSWCSACCAEVQKNPPKHEHCFS